MASLTTALPFLATLLALTGAELSALQWSDCGSTAVRLDHLSATPMPVELPGTMKLSIRGQLLEPWNRLSVHFSIKRITFLLNIPIPCIRHIGSCTYEDSCEVLDQMEREDWAGIAAGLATEIRGLLTSLNITRYCPVMPRSLQVTDYPIRLPSMPSILSWFAEGDYSVKLTATDRGSDVPKLCLDVKLSAKKHEEPCSGFLCSIFG